MKMNTYPRVSSWLCYVRTDFRNLTNIAPQTVPPLPEFPEPTSWSNSLDDAERDVTPCQADDPSELSQLLLDINMPLPTGVPNAVVLRSHISYSCWDSGPEFTPRCDI